MARLSDLIKQGKVPEKKLKEEVKIRDLASLKEDKEKIDGQVVEALPNTTFKIVLGDDREVLAYLSGKMRLHHIKVMLGDRVSLELSPDGTRGRIIRRL